MIFEFVCVMELQLTIAFASWTLGRICLDLLPQLPTPERTKQAPN